MSRAAKVLPSKKQVAAIKRAVDHVGSQSILAERLDLWPASVSNWCKGLNGVTSNNAKKIEKLTHGKVKAYELSSYLMRKKEEEDGDPLSLYR